MTVGCIERDKEGKKKKKEQKSNRQNDLITEYST